MMRIVVVAILVAVILLAIGVGSFNVSEFRLASAAPSRQIALCSDEPNINEEVNKIAFQALDKALHDQIERLFSTWMKDETGQPERAATGVKRAAVAYVHARTAILEWNIPPCTPK